MPDEPPTTCAGQGWQARGPVAHGSRLVIWLDREGDDGIQREVDSSEQIGDGTR